MQVYVKNLVCIGTAEKGNLSAWVMKPNLEWGNHYIKIKLNAKININLLWLCALVPGNCFHNKATDSVAQNL
jgi:hypothetical protein